MTEVIAGMASSHAYTFLAPSQWDERRLRSIKNYERRYGSPPPIPSELEAERTEDNEVRFQPIADGLISLRETLETLAPDAFILIGDDQGENFKSVVPQFAIYTGDHVITEDNESGKTIENACDATLATAILDGVVASGVDMSACYSFPDDKLLSHAHAQILVNIAPTMPIVPIFVNAINPPGPTPARCFEVGQVIRQVLDNLGDNKRVVVYASGGLSHFSAGYPYGDYCGPLRLGSIQKEFDRSIVDAMRNGQGQELTKLTSRELLDNGEIELRQWIVLMGMLGGAVPEWLHCDAFHRGVMNMAVGYWPISA